MEKSEIIRKLFLSSTEELDPIEGQVTGDIPAAINGTFLRVGPGKFDLDSGYTVNHYFDGYALLSKYHIRGGSNPSISFQSRYLDTDAYKKAVATGKPMCNEFGSKSEQDMGKTYFQKMYRTASLIMVPNLTDNCNYAVFAHGKDTFAMGETSSFHEINVNSLTSICRHDMPKYFGFYQFTPHPLRDLRTGDVYNVGTSVKTGLKYNLVRIPPKQGNISAKEHYKKNLKIVASMPSRWKTWIGCAHSFGMSENYAIYVEQPHVVNIARYLANGLARNEPYKLWLEWHPEYPNRFYVIDKRTGKVLSAEYLASDLFFFLHIINCYEDTAKDLLIVDISTYDDPSVLDIQYIQKLRSENSYYGDRYQASVRRYFIPLRTAGETEKEKVLVRSCEIVGKGLEMVMINEFNLGRPYSFGYGTSITASSAFSKSIAKINFRTEETLRWSAGPNHIFGEVVFVPADRRRCVATLNSRSITNEKKGGIDSNNNEGDRSIFDPHEDDGYLIVPSMDIRDGHPDYIYFLNAKTMEEMGRVTFNVRIPPGFHGQFISC